jgi:DNA invertase Pin-like site-specific DNA recombinase
MLKAAGYLRKSTKMQEQSIPDQKKALLQYADSNGFNIVQWYVDDGISGTITASRKAFLQMTKDGQKPECNFKYILVYDMSRWGRFLDSEESTYWRVHFKMQGIEVIYTHDDIPKEENVYAPVIKSLKSSAATDHARNIAKTVVRGAKSNAQLGFWNGGNAPFGYRRMLCDALGNPKQILKNGEQKNLNTEKVKLVLGPANEVKTIQLIFDLYASEQMGMRAIAQHLTSKGILSPGFGQNMNVRDHKGVCVQRKNSGVWGLSIIERILSNYIYTGAIVYGKAKTGKFSRKENLWGDQHDLETSHDKKNHIIKEDAHEALISKEQFLKVQAIRQNKNCFKKGSPGRIKNSPYLLTGLFFCDSCGSKLIGWSPKFNGKSYQYYKDAGKNGKGIQYCNAKNIPRFLIDTFILENISNRLKSKIWINRFKDRLYDRFNNKENTENNVDSYLLELAKLRKEMDNLYESIALVGMNESLRLSLQKRQNQIDQLEQIIKTLNNKKDNQNDNDMVIDNFMNAIKNTDKVLHQASNDEKKLIIRKFVRKAVYYKDKKEVEFQFYKIPEFSNISSSFRSSVKKLQILLGEPHSNRRWM